MWRMPAVFLEVSCVLLARDIPDEVESLHVEFLLECRIIKSMCTLKRGQLTGK